jgi:hypothetical protein
MYFMTNPVPKGSTGNVEVGGSSPDDANFERSCKGEVNIGLDMKPICPSDRGESTDVKELGEHNKAAEVETRDETNKRYKYLRVKLGPNQRPTVSRLIESTFGFLPMPRKEGVAESWTRHCFAIPIEREEELRAYLMRWYPKQLFHTVPAQQEKLVRQASCTRRILRRNLSVLDACRLPLPQMSHQSSLITHVQVRILLEHLLTIADGRPWQLVYGTLNHGFSLNTLYRNTSKIQAATLVLVQDTENRIFGAMVPCSLVCTEGFYGTGESFLFTFHPIFKKYCWSGKNDYFINGTPTSLSIGTGDSAYGLWMDDNLHRGRSQRCETYDNDPLTESEDFHIKAVEIWAFPFSL